MGYFVLKKQVTFSLFFSVSLITLGILLSCSSVKGQSSFFGIFILALASLAEVFKLLITQLILQDQKMSVIESHHLLSPPSVFFLLIASYFFEYDEFMKREAYNIIFNYKLIFLFAIIIGVFVNYITSLVIQKTSSLTMKILGIVRNLFLVFYGIFIKNDSISTNQIYGYSIVTLGLILYNLSELGIFTLQLNQVFKFLNTSNNISYKQIHQMDSGQISPNLNSYNDSSNQDIESK